MKEFFVKLSKEYTAKRVRIHSSSATFYIIVSIIPQMAILFYVLSLLSSDLSRELEAFLSGLLPKELSSSFYSLIQSIKSSNLSALVPFSVITALWGSTKGVSSICFAIEEIYISHKRTRVLKRILKSLWRTLLFYLLIVSFVLLIFLSKIIPHPSLILNIALELRIIIFILSLLLFFAAVYSRLSGKSLKSQLIGALFSSVGWSVFSYIFSVYLSFTLNSNSIYAEMSAPIFFMLFCYFSVNIILIGALINKIL